MTVSTHWHRFGLALLLWAVVPTCLAALDRIASAGFVGGIP